MSESQYRIERLVDGEVYLNHMGWGKRLNNTAAMRVGYLALRDNDPEATSHEGHVAWASYIHEEATGRDEEHIFLNCCFTHPCRRGEQLFTKLFEHLTRCYPDMPVRGVFVNRRLEDFVERYNDSLAGMLVG